MPDGDRAVVATIEVLGRIESFLGLVGSGDIGNDAARKEVLFFEGEGVSEGFERGAGGAWGKCPVDLTTVFAFKVR